MGNSPPTGLRLSNGYRSISYHAQLGESGAIYFRRREVQQRANGEITESWKMSYKVDDSICDFSLTTRNKGNITKALFYDNVLALEIDIEDAVDVVPEEYSFYVTACRNEAGQLLPGRLSFPIYHWDDPGSVICIARDSTSTIPKYLENSTTTNASDGINYTRFYTYGLKSRRRGLIVIESKCKRMSAEPYKGTVTHYYANAENGKDVGLSVAVKNISVKDGHLDFAVDGPQQLPVGALFKMFDEVLRTGTWKPTYCPHCANNMIQRQRAGMFSQYDSEDCGTDNVLAALLRVGRQNAGAILNNAVLKGNYNGNLNINYYKIELFGGARNH